VLSLDAFLQPHSIAWDHKCFYTANVAEHIEGATKYTLKQAILCREAGLARLSRANELTQKTNGVQ
jgi:hypothetical protein